MAQDQEALKEFRRLREKLEEAIEGMRVADVAVSISPRPWALWQDGMLETTDYQRDSVQRVADLLDEMEMLAMRHWG